MRWVTDAGSMHPVPLLMGNAGLFIQKNLNRANPVFKNAERIMP